MYEEENESLDELKALIESSGLSQLEVMSVIEGIMARRKGQCDKGCEKGCSTCTSCSSCSASNVS